MAALAFLLSLVQLVLVGVGVTVIGGNELHNLAFGLALLALGFLLGAAPALPKIAR